MHRICLHRTLILACCMATLGCPLTPGAAAEPTTTVAGGGIALSLTSAGAVDGVTDITGQALPAKAGGLRFLSAPPLQPDTLTDPQWSTTGAAKVLQGTLQHTGVKVQATFSGSADRLTVTMQLTNPTGERKLLQVELALPCPGSTGESWTFFDGYADTVAPRTKYARPPLGGLFPLGAVCDAQRGLAVGIPADEVHSWIAAGIDPTPEVRELSYAVRRVLDPGAGERASFVVFGFDGQWGTALAIDRYYDLFPAAFGLPAAVDRRFGLAGGYVHGGYATPELRWEESRRLHHGWQPNWGFRRTGNWMPDEAHWPATGGDFKAYVTDLRNTYSRAAPGNPICHYVEPTQCEADLAEQEFADSIQWTKAGPTKRYLEAVPVINGEACCHTFPFANSFFRSTMAQIPPIISDLKACGIYIDNASGGNRHYGKDLTGVTGRAFDDDGAVYATSGVGTAAIADLVHTLPNGYGNAGVPTNGVGTYTVAFHTDASIQEGTPWERAASVAAMRRMLGGKSLCWWEDHLENALRWRALTPAQIIEAMHANVTYCVLYGLRWGIMPAVHVQRGRAELVRNMPLLAELVQAGWRPVVPVTCDSRLWTGRYGKGIGSAITVGNPTRDTIAVDLAIANQALHPTAALTFAYHEKTAQAGTPLENTLAATATHIRFSLPPKEFRVLTAVAGWRPGADPVTVEAVQQRDGRDRLVTGLRLRQGEAALTALPPSVRELSGPLPTVRARADQRWRWIVAEPAFSACDKTALWDFPFLRDGKAAAAIVVSSQAGEGERRAAARLGAYFEYALGRRADLMAGVDKLADPSRRLSVVTESDKTPEGVARILLGSPATHAPLSAALAQVAAARELADPRGETAGLIALQGGELIIASRAPDNAEATVLFLLGLLDG